MLEELLDVRFGGGNVQRERIMMMFETGVTDDGD